MLEMELTDEITQVGKDLDPEGSALQILENPKYSGRLENGTF
jgi:hypothetical protein